MEITLGAIIFILDIIAIVSLLFGHGTALHKIIWILIILIFPFIGVLAYFIFGRKPTDV